MSIHNEDITNSLWVEKYRPKKLDEIVLEENQKKFLERCFQKDEIPHILLVGPPGSGKCHSGDETIDIYIDE